MVAQVGVLNLNASAFTGLNHLRVVQVDEAAGGYSLTESWLATSGSRAIEDFDISIRFSQEEGLTSVGINGSIRGLETRTYGATSGAFAINETKWEAASGHWAVVKPKLLGRATLASREITSRTINPQPLTASLSKSPTKGTITYTYEYNDRPCNFISNAIYENITVSDTYPADVFAAIPILGRAYGPILQDIGTITESRRTVNIDVLVNPISGCGAVSGIMSSRPTAEVRAFLCQMQSEISGENVQLFKSQDSDNWNPKTGRYSRTVEWVWTQCGGTPPSTDFCS